MFNPFKKKTKVKQKTVARLTLTEEEVVQTLRDLADTKAKQLGLDLSEASTRIISREPDNWGMRVRWIEDYIEESL